CPLLLRFPKQRCPWKILRNHQFLAGSVNVRFAPKAIEVLRCRELTRCANRVHLLATQPPLKSLPLISPRQYWHPHQRYDRGLRRLHTLNAFTGRLKPLRASSPANSTSTSVSTALNTLISTRICPSLA